MNATKIIEFGGGDCPRFHPNFDIRQLPNVDVVIDLNKPLPIPDSDYDFVYSKYMLEHISWRNVKNFLQEIYKIPKPEGKITLTTANLLEQAKILVNITEWNDNFIGMIFGAQDFNENFHQNGFSPIYITKILEDIGFHDINITPINSDFGPTDMVVEARKQTKEHENKLDKPILTIPYKNDNPPKIITNVDRQLWILNHCEIGKNIIDIGGNDGHIFNGTPFAKYVTTVDIDKYDIPNFYQMDATNLQFQDKSFDIAILAEILEHVEKPVQVLKEANRVAKRILMTIPNEYEWDKSLFPFQTLEEASNMKNKTIEELAIEGNPRVKEFYTNDDYKHLFHNRYYTEDTLRKDLDLAEIKDYRLEKLKYGQPQWSFFVVDTNPKDKSTIEDDSKVSKETFHNDTQYAKNVIKKGPTITTGPIIPKDMRAEITRNINDNPLKIGLISTPLLVIPPKGYSGLEMVLWDLACGLDELGHEVTLFGPQGSNATKHGKLITTGSSISTVGIDWFEEEKKRYNVYKDIITPDKFDIVHDHTWFSFAYLIKMINPKLNMIHTHHGSFGWETLPPIAKPNLVAISNFMKQHTISYFSQKGYKVACESVYNGINLDKYPYQQNKGDNMLFVGRLSAFKQPHLAIELARKTGHKLDILGGTFVDSIEYVNQLDKMIENDPNIKIYKDVTHEFKIEKMQNAMALIFPSSMGEPFGTVLLEAMACGTPTIALNDGAISEVVIHNKTGFICNSTEEMIEAVNKIHTISHEDCRKRAEELSRKVMAENYVKLYKRILNNDEW